AWELGLGNNVVADFIGGGPDEFPDRYQFASPFERLPLAIPQKLLHGTGDTSVPYEISERYVAAALNKGDPAELITLQRAGHFELVDPRTVEFAAVKNAVLRLIT